jgi:hypothetical protein
MTPAEYVREIVLPTTHEFKVNPRSRRHVYLTCMTVFHIKDHLRKARPKEIDIERKMRNATGKSFDVVRAICNGTKHVETDPTHPIGFRVGDDFDRPPGRVGQMQTGVSRAGDSIGGREIGQNPIERIDIYEACKATLIAFCTLFPNHLGDCDLSGL